MAELTKALSTAEAMVRDMNKRILLGMTAYRKRNDVFETHSYEPDPNMFWLNEKKNTRQFIEAFGNGFMLVVTYRGLVVVVSENIRDYLGYEESELLGTNVFDIVHKEDHSMLWEQLMPRSCSLDRYGELVIPDELGAEEYVANLLSEEKRTFIIRFVKKGCRSDPSVYVTCHIDGVMRKSRNVLRGSGMGPPMQGRGRATSDNPFSSGKDVMFASVVHPYIDGYKSEGILESYGMEYRTRHFKDGTTLDCDHRISLVTGYMREEVIGVTAMNFMHRNDVRWVMFGFNNMFRQEGGYGETYYRLLMKTGQYLYMRTRGQVDVDKSNKAMTTLVCTNTVMDDTEGKFFLEQMKKKYSVTTTPNPVTAWRKYFID